ncbi:aspartic peptidase domain-containing protein [Cokeromyces recurvatus]|uniref:aspartic peptidase domain-containing protein n=1 Tax=Cokeromyces recurvatus TaxID=90255 RepID=UPI002220C92E|nr:aspartic peptidase domain-containing protein [Cokeromyces recurvatus]KAI7905523.1 aspartic peptidase domain-containing protein [Cokeromyces recurvatus]
MKLTLFFVAINMLVLHISAETMHRIPLYYHNKRSSHGGHSKYVSAGAKELRDGMLGGVVQIGNPPQNFTLAFDTSTGFTWVRDIDCNTKNCKGRKAYDPKESTTVDSTGHSFVLDYGKGIVDTTIYEDTFHFAGLTVKRMPFGGAYEMKKFNKGFDGFLGLGRNINLNSNATVHYSKRSGDQIPTSGFIPNAYQQGNGLSSSQFGMYTTFISSDGGSGFSDSGSVSSTTNPTSAGTHFTKRSHHEQPAGYLVIGGVDKSAIKGNVYYVDTKHSHHSDSGNWAVPVTAAKFKDNHSFKVSPKAKAIFSSSTDVIGLPNAQAEEFRKRWYAEYDKSDNTFKVPCCLMNRLTSFAITFGKVEAVVPPSYWSESRKTTTCCEMCHTHIGKSDSDTDYVIGRAFTYAFYTQFDFEKNRVGLAMKKHQKNDGLKLIKH